MATPIPPLKCYDTEGAEIIADALYGLSERRLHVLKGPQRCCLVRQSALQGEEGAVKILSWGNPISVRCFTRLPGAISWASFNVSSDTMTRGPILKARDIRSGSASSIPDTRARILPKPKVSPIFNPVL